MASYAGQRRSWKFGSFGCFVALVAGGLVAIDALRLFVTILQFELVLGMVEFLERLPVLRSVARLAFQFCLVRIVVTAKAGRCRKVVLARNDRRLPIPD